MRCTVPAQTPSADELDHVEKPALGRWRCRSLLGLPSPAQRLDDDQTPRATPPTGSGMERNQFLSFAKSS
jgi:hypothetical protein